MTSGPATGPAAGKDPARNTGKDPGENATTAGSASAARRLAEVDALRGFALWGILLVNTTFMASAYRRTPATYTRGPRTNWSPWTW